MSAAVKHKKIGSIPVKVIGTKGTGPGFHNKRRFAQVLTIALMVLIPVSGLLRIDPEAGAFVVVDRQIWFSDFFLMSGLWIMVASSLVMLYSSAGTVFCGWVCPQNTLSEWANGLTHKLLGKRADLNLDGSAARVAAAKNKTINWLMLGLIFLATAMLFAIIPLLFFYPPEMVWHFITLQHDEHLARSLYWIYTVSVLVIFLDISMIRHFWCRFSCIYRVWQHTFKTKQTLHVAYDKERSEECAKCNYCVTACFINLDPRKTDIYDSCINCGECIDACNRLHAKQGGPGLLRFEMGERKQNRLTQFRNATVSLFARTRWATTFLVLGILLFARGIWTYEPYHLAVYRAESQQTHSLQNYQISIANKLYRPAKFEVEVQGLPENEYHLSTKQLDISPAGRKSISLAISPDLPHGLYSVLITVSALDGWTGHARIQHLAD